MGDEEDTIFNFDLWQCSKYEQTQCKMSTSESHILEFSRLCMCKFYACGNVIFKVNFGVYDGS